MGAVAGFLILALAGLNGTVAVYPSLDLTTQYLIMPLALLTLALGTLQSLLTPWGLVRHYWVLIKLILTLLVVLVLWLQTGNIRMLASLPTEALRSAEWSTARFSMVLHSGAGLVVLLVAAILSVYKPAGLTRYGWSRRYAATVPDDGG